MTDHLVVPLRVARHGEHPLSARLHEPVTAGVPFPRGAVHDTNGWLLTAADGSALPVQMTVNERWPDGSIRWALIDSRVTLPSGAAMTALMLTRSVGAPASPTGETITTAPTPEGLQIDTGAALFLLAPHAPLVIARSQVQGRTTFDGRKSELRVRGGAGDAWAVAWDSSTVESGGPLRIVTATHGTATAPDGRQLQLVLRHDFFAGHSAVRIRLTVRNPQRADHPGGIWELGDAGSILLDEFSLVLNAGATTSETIWFSIEPGQSGGATDRFYIYQDSSGGESWSSTNHVTRDGAVAPRIRGYEGFVDGAPIAGRRATPVACLQTDVGGLGVAVPRFWENFPRAIDLTRSVVALSFFPAGAAAPHELQGGEQKTHECYLLFGPDSITADPLDWCRSRLVMHPEPSWYVDSRAVDSLVAAADDDPRYRSLVDAAIEGEDTFQSKREVADEYGWRHFGDIYGDHEAVFHRGPSPLTSHYNNQYDPIAGFLYQFMRTGDLRWWTQCLELASHVIDIDIYHTDRDKSAYNHGLFWHTYHYTDAGKATHRSYPAGTNGGGPSSEQNYPTGLMLHYFLTGDMASREAALGLARFVIDTDDGSRTVFRWLDRGYTGVASASRTSDYHGPGRGSGNSLNALLDGHRLSGDRQYLDKAEQIIRRCTHPTQDIDALQLLDPENRWFYTIHLQSVGKYLERKIECNEIDAMYAYGRDVLLHYARWMAIHERPYLTHPELLEYPTETWAAQDIRKSEVFDHAARYSGDALERERFLERAEFFFEEAVCTLQRSPTRTLTRPVVLLMVHGSRRAHVRANGLTIAPLTDADWSHDWPVPESFIPQRAQARRRLIQLLAILAFALGGLAVLILADIL